MESCLELDILREAPREDLADAIDQLRGLELAARRARLQVEAVYDERKLYADDYVPSMTEWQMLRYGDAWRTANESVRVGRALLELPHIGEAMSEGRLSWDHIRALTRFVSPATDEQWAREASGWTVSALEREARRANPVTTAEAVDDLEGRRAGKRWTSNRRMLKLWAQLPGADAAVFEQIWDLLADGLPCDPETGFQEPYPMRLADALIQMARHVDVPAEDGAVGGDLPPGNSPDSDDAPAGGPESDDAPVAGEPPEPPEPPEPAVLEAAGSQPAQARRRRPRRIYGRVDVHATVEALASPEGYAELRNGVQLCSETARRLMCNSSWRMVAFDADGNTVAIGTNSRIPTPGMVDALWVRDRGCVICGETRWVESHHVWPWIQGGPTELWNLALACWPCHRLLHEYGWRLVGNAEKKLTLLKPDGTPLRRPPAMLRREIRERFFGPHTRSETDEGGPSPRDADGFEGPSPPDTS